MSEIDWTCIPCRAVLSELPDDAGAQGLRCPWCGGAITLAEVGMDEDMNVVFRVVPDAEYTDDTEP